MTHPAKNYRYAAARILAGLPVGIEPKFGDTTVRSYSMPQTFPMPPYRFQQMDLSGGISNGLKIEGWGGNG